jgi:23S rRNA (guanosine2251-2'-O)-methyltransferase
MPHIVGRNPVVEALQNNQPIEKIYIQYNSHGDKISHIYKLARSGKIPITKIDSRKIKKIVGEVNHQGVIALISPIRTVTLETLLENATKGTNPSFMAILDRINDPHNMGAIIRSAEVFGASGVIYPAKENVPLTETVIRASAGAAFHIPICKSGNLVATIEQLKESGFWIYGSETVARDELWKMDFNRNCAIIIGGEEKGIRPLIRKHCDVSFKIPQIGKTGSLNASVAAGVIFSEVLRQSRASGL